jgi:hypothetical protein
VHHQLHRRQGAGLVMLHEPPNLGGVSRLHTTAASEVRPDSLDQGPVRRFGGPWRRSASYPAAWRLGQGTVHRLFSLSA